VYEDIFTAVFRSDKSEALTLVEELHRAPCHLSFLISSLLFELLPEARAALFARSWRASGVIRSVATLAPFRNAE
jgi:hypothetical protein